MCGPNYESCNLVETFWVVAFWFLVFVGVCTGAYFLIKWICDSMNSSSLKNNKKLLKQASIDQEGTTLIIMGKNCQD